MKGGVELKEKCETRKKSEIILIVIFVPLVSIHGGWVSDAWNLTKQTTNKVFVATHLKSDHLKSMEFDDIYPKEFYKKSYFGLTITIVAVVGAGAFTYFTAGAGAPAAATGASAVASWVAGGGAGSYMAGLSMIGSWFGGNAILGAAILNGLSIGVLGGGVGLGAKLANMGILSKVGMGLSVTALAMDGIAYFENPKTKQLEYKVRLTIPKNLGTKKVRAIVNKIYNDDEKIQNALKNKDGQKQKYAFYERERHMKEAIDILKQELDCHEKNPEDMVVLATIANNMSEYSLFYKALLSINSSKLEGEGFLDYLFSLNELYSGNIYNAKKELRISIEQNKYALEPIVLLITILGYEDFNKNVHEIEELASTAEKNFYSDDYATPLNLTTLYYRIGTLFFINEKYSEAEYYFKKAKDNIGFIQKHFGGKQILHTLDLAIANSMYKDGRKSSATSLYYKILSDTQTNDEYHRIKDNFVGNN